MSKSTLYKKVYGALIGAAIGDAMGGPVEMYHYKKIIEKHGWVDSLLPYDEIEPNVHGPWAKDAGAYTDDSRMSKIFCEAILECKRVPDSKDIAKAYIDYYHYAAEGLPKEFIEEYYMKAVYQERKQVFGGQPTNGGIMGIAPYGVINACNPKKALSDAYEAMFIVEGYAKYSAAIAAAAIAAAMKPEATVQSIIDDSLEALHSHKESVEGDLWRNCHMYPHVAMKNESLIRECIKVADKYDNTEDLREELFETVAQQFFADGSETLAIAMTMVYKADGDYERAVEGCINFGRDNDSSGSVAGAITGALNGVEGIKPEWVELVEKVNAQPTFAYYAEKITDIILKNNDERQRVCSAISHLKS